VHHPAQHKKRNKWSKGCREQLVWVRCCRTTGPPRPTTLSGARLKDNNLVSTHKRGQQSAHTHTPRIAEPRQRSVEGGGGGPAPCTTATVGGLVACDSDQHQSRGVVPNQQRQALTPGAIREPATDVGAAKSGARRQPSLAAVDAISLRGAATSATGCGLSGHVGALHRPSSRMHRDRH